MTTEPMMSERVKNDLVREAVRARVAAEDRIAELDEALKAVTPKVGSTATTLRRLQLEADREGAEAERVAAQRTVEAAQQAARARIVAARKPEQLALDRALLAATEQLHALAVNRQRYDEATAALMGLAPPPFVAPALLTLGETIERLRRAISGPPPPAPAPPPRPGEVRLRLTIDSFHDREANRYVLRGDIFDIDARDGRDLLKAGGAVEVGT